MLGKNVIAQVMPPPLLPTRRKKKRFDVRDRDPHHYLTMCVFQLMEAGLCWGGSVCWGLRLQFPTVLNSEVGASIFQFANQCSMLDLTIQISIH